MDSLSRLPLYLQVKNYITSMIDSGDYPADSKLPTEKELMKTLGVGRATVRSALSELEHDGRIYKRHGVGTFVSSNKWMPAFEPIISLTYSLERLGMEIRNVIISSGLEYPKDELAKNFPRDKKSADSADCALPAARPLPLRTVTLPRSSITPCDPLTRTSRWRTRYLTATASMLTELI